MTCKKTPKLAAMEVKPRLRIRSLEKLIPQVLIKDSLILFHKSFNYINSLLFQGPKNPPQNTNHPIFTRAKNVPERSVVIKGAQKKQEDPKERPNKSINNAAGSVSFSNCGGLRLKEDRNNACKKRKQQKEEEDLSTLAFEALAQKMRELEMDFNDVNHTLDVEEVLHYYSRLKCPAYLEIIEKFFMDMYLEYRLPQPYSSSSRISSMRKGGSAHGSMREVRSNSVHGSMRSLAPLKM